MNLGSVVQDFNVQSLHLFGCNLYCIDTVTSHKSRLRRVKKPTTIVTALISIHILNFKSNEFIIIVGLAHINPFLGCGLGLLLL